MSAAPPTTIDRLKLAIGRAAFRGIVIGLSSGIALHLMNQTYWSAMVLSWTCGILIGLPVVNVIGVLVDETRRRDWGFVAIAAAVLALLAYALASRLL